MEQYKNIMSEQDYDTLSIGSNDDNYTTENISQLKEDRGFKKRESYYKPNEITAGFEGKVIGRGNVYALRNSPEADKILAKWS
jgi:hypothetical protein